MSGVSRDASGRMRRLIDDAKIPSQLEALTRQGLPYVKVSGGLYRIDGRADFYPATGFWRVDNLRMGYGAAQLAKALNCNPAAKPDGDERARTSPAQGMKPAGSRLADGRTSASSASEKDAPQTSAKGVTAGETAPSPPSSRAALPEVNWG